MTCDLARQALNQWIDGEPPSRPLALVGHVATCPGCRAARAALARQRRALRTLPISAPPEELRARVLSVMPARVEGSRAATAGRPRRLGFALRVVAVAGVAGWLLVAAPFGNRKLMAADVRAAVGRVNVWHLSGWKRVGGRQVPWEIWGRRFPFFYRERLGEAVTYDDGAQRLQLIPPLPAWKMRGFLLRTASRPGDESTGWSYEAMFQRWAEDPRRFAESRTSVVFNFNSAGMEGLGTTSDYLYTVSKRTSLPVRYEVRRHDGKGHTTVAEVLTADYPWLLPGSAKRQDWAVGARRIDTLAAPAPRALAGGRAASRNGLTVQAEPLRMDEEGQVLVRVRGWLGGEQLGKDWELQWNVNGPGATEGGDATWPVKDDRGRLYVEVRTEDLMGTAFPGDHVSIYVPVEPLPAGAPLPRSLHLSLRVDPQVPQPLSGVLGHSEARMLMSETFELAVDLPDQPAVLDPQTFLDPLGEQRFRTLEPEPLEASIAGARAWYYGRYYDRRDPSPAGKERIRQSIRWGLQYLELMPETTTRAQLRRFDVARWWIELGEWEQAERLLRQMIAISEHQPQMAGYYRKMAEQELDRMRKRQAKARRLAHPSVRAKAAPGP